MKITIIDAKGNRKDYEIDYNKHKKERVEKTKATRLDISDIEVPKED